MMGRVLKIGPDQHLTTRVVAEFARDPKTKIALSLVARTKVKQSRAVIERIIRDKKVVYGVNTGFGNFKNKIIAPTDLRDLQQNLIRSHSVGVGEMFSAEVVRAALLIRLNSLARGHSGIRLEFLESWCNILNNGITPMVPSQGSVGSSGDLAPLSHMGLVLIGEGKAWYKDELLGGGEVLKRAGLKPMTFEAKEGLAWTNGTAVMTGIAALTAHDAGRIANIADIACALTLEAICGSSKAFDQHIHKTRPHPGQIHSASRIRRAITGSKLIDSRPDRVQDAYSIRCAPQVHGACRDALVYVSEVVGRELNSVTDNPLIFSKPDRAISGGNFHGEPIAIAMDVLAIAIAELANISERRTAKLVDAATNEGLPMFLISPEKAGLNNGLMMPQYTAAALVSENKILSHPASVDSIPTSANQEDHVSMGTIAARKAVKILENTENVLSIELLTACQGIDFRNPRKLGYTTKQTYKIIRRQISNLSEDRELAGDINRIKELIKRVGLFDDILK